MDLKGKSGIFVGWSIQDKVIFFGNIRKLTKYWLFSFVLLPSETESFGLSRSQLKQWRGVFRDFSNSGGLLVI
jgi:hypothetical protein